jgi:putative restriction endonuclease
MKLFVAPTDFAWYSFLAEKQPEEINFWQPSAKAGFRALDNGDPLESGNLFLFKLKGSINMIAGGGIFIGYSQLQLSVAWSIFGEHNGAESFDDFSGSIRGYMNQERAHSSDPHIGCIVLTQPFFWPKPLWMPPPTDWSPNIVRGKRYTTDTELGRLLYAAVQERLQLSSIPEMTLEENRFGAPTLIQPRLGQGGFRYTVTERYERRCAMTGERSLPALEAAHIKPYRENGPHLISNGLLLRADLHRLFDTGYVTITSDYRVKVSRQLKEDFSNGRDYYAMDGRPLIVLPHQVHDKPRQDFVDWHNAVVFRK